MSMTQPQAICRRWIQIVALTICGGAVAGIWLPVLSGWGASLGKTLAKSLGASRFGHVDQLFPICLALLLVLGWMLLHHLMAVDRRRFPTYMHHAAAYPSWGAAAFLGCVILGSISIWLLERNSISDGLNLILIVLSSACIAFFYGLCMETRACDEHNTRSPSNSPPARPKDFREIVNNIDLLEDWVNRNDDPILHPEEDLFGMQQAAQRIAGRLMYEYAETDRKKGLRSYGLIGDYGSGKTSILKMVEGYLKKPTTLPVNPTHQKPRQFITAWVDGWGVDSEDNAAQYVLQKAVKAISRQADALALTIIPAHYRQALKSSGLTWLGLISELLHSRQDTKELLDIFDNLLTAIDKHMVLFVEDLDRNIDGGDGKLLQVQALLDRINRYTDRVTFVLAVGQKTQDNSAKIDYAKLCQEVEVLSVLPTDLCLTAFKTVYEDWCQRRYKEYIPVVVLAHDGYDRRGDDLLNATTGSTGRLLASLLSTPRSLKLALRDTMNAWDGKPMTGGVPLRGEIDFIELLIISMFRRAVPEVYNFILRNIKAMRGNNIETMVNPANQKNESSRLQLRNAWDMDKKGWRLDHYKETAAWALLIKIFGKNLTGKDDSLSGFQHTLQSIAHGPCEGVDMSSFGGNTDYWSRMHAREVQDLTDQEVIRTMSSWNDNHGRGELAQRMLNTYGFAAKVEQFDASGIVQCRLDGGQLRKLASQIHELTLNHDGAKANMREVDAMETPFRLAPGRKYPEKLHSKWLEKEIKNALNTSLRLALDLALFWGEVHFGNNVRPAAREVILTGVKSRIDTDGEAYLSRVLDPNYPDTLYHMIRSWHIQPNEKENGLATENWIWIGPVLLNLANEPLGTFVPHLSSLIAKVDGPSSERGREIYRSELDIEFIELFWPDETQRRVFLQQIAKGGFTSDLSEDQHQFIRDMRNQIQSYLDET